MIYGSFRSEMQSHADMHQFWVVHLLSYHIGFQYEYSLSYCENMFCTKSEIVCSEYKL